MTKKLKQLLLLILISVFLLAACGKDPDDKSETEEMIVSLLVDKYGINDKSINSKAYLGLKNFKVDTATKIDYESSRSDDYEYAFEKLVNRGGRLIWGAGFQTADALKQAAIDHRELNFASLDNIYDEDNMPKNLTGTIFNTEETSYLLGYVAGLSTKTNRLAYIGGQEGVLSDKNEYGFRAGVFDASKERKKKINVTVEYTKTFSDEGKGRATAKALYESGVDIIFTDCGLGNLGAIEAAKETGKLILVTEEELIKKAPNNVIMSASKEYEEAINTISSRFIANEEIGGKNFELGFKNNCLDIKGYDQEKNLIEAQVYDKALNKKKDIIEGKKKVPYDQKTFEKFSSSSISNSESKK